MSTVAHPAGVEPFDADAQQDKAFSPAVAPRVEERLDLATHRIDAREISLVRALLEIAALASQREVVASAVLLRDDVLDVVRYSAVLLAEQATVPCPSAAKLPRRGINRPSPVVVGP